MAVFNAIICLSDIVSSLLCASDLKLKSGAVLLTGS